MAKLSKRIVDHAEAGDKDYFIWDDELPGFGLRVFKSGKRSYLVQYRAKGRTRRFTIGTHGVWTPEDVSDAMIELVTRGFAAEPSKQLTADIHLAPIPQSTKK